jgi:lambda family phage portal protein
MTGAVAAAKPRVRVPARGIAMPLGGGSVRPAPSAAFMRGGHGPTFANWMPSLREASDDVKAAWRIGTARAVDAMQNSGWLAGAVDQSAASVCGTGLKLSLQPDMSFLNWDEDQTSEWARLVERRYELWANNPRACDIRGQSTVGQLGTYAYRHWMASGEIVATLPWFKHEGSQFGTKLALKPAWQLSDRSDEMNGLCQGVRLNKVGAPTSYLFNVKTPIGGKIEVEVKAFDGAGRPLAMHVFDGGPGQVRGITPFISVLKVGRQFDQLADATLTAAIVQALFAAIVKTAAKPEDALAMLQVADEGTNPPPEADIGLLVEQKAKWYDKTDINLGIAGRIAHMFPGDELQFLRSEHPNSTYEAFSRLLLRELRAPLAMTYEEFSGDWTGATYSSIRMSNAMNWPRVMYRRNNIVGRFHQIGLEAWMEEDIEAGGTELPGGVETFLANKDSICRAVWRGPPKPQADDVKAAVAHKTYKEMGNMTDAMICADLGIDEDDLYEQLVREKRRRENLGLPSPSYSNSAQQVLDKENAQNTNSSGSGNGNT